MGTPGTVLPGKVAAKDLRQVAVQNGIRGRNDRRESKAKAALWTGFEIYSETISGKPNHRPPNPVYLAFSIHF
jgi:hypothetical protein